MRCAWGRSRKFRWSLVLPIVHPIDGRGNIACHVREFEGLRGECSAFGAWCLRQKSETASRAPLRAKLFSDRTGLRFEGSRRSLRILGEGVKRKVWMRGGRVAEFGW